MKSQSRPQPTIPSLYATLTAAVSLTLFCSLSISPVLAQSISIDGSTPTTQLNGVDSCSGNCDITGGLRDGDGSGNNLFHSFSSFNVDNGSTVTFQDLGVDNIFSRVTGNGLSNIDGILTVDGTANLFFFNPNGIIFGESARLDLQGSFLSSTADSILFENGVKFSASDSTTPSSMLTVSTPTGLQFGNAPKAIQIEGSGHSLFYDRAIFRNPPFAPPSSGLQVATGQSLALIGGDIDIAGGNLVAEAGHIKIGSVGRNGQVSFSDSDSRWQFGYNDVSEFRDISFSQAASVDVSSIDAGSIQLQGRQISMREGSALLAQVAGSGNGEISVKASEKLQLIGEDIFVPPNFFTMPTSIYVEIAPSGTGDGNSVLSINSPEIDITKGAQIGLTMAGSGQAGSVQVQSNIINVDGVSNLGPSAIFTTVAPFDFTSPDASGGDLTIHTQQLNVSNEASVVANTFGPGNGGDLYIYADEVSVDGFGVGPSILGTNSSVSSTTSLAPPTDPPALIPGGSGDSGSALIETRRITVTNGGQVSTRIVSDSNAGSLTIRATEAVELNGRTNAGRGGLFASAFEGNGNGGDIVVVTDVLSVLNGATINASNFQSAEESPRNSGNGSAGNINLTTRVLEIKDGGAITVNTVAGDRANIDIKANSLVLRRGSSITTNATGDAIGGNINIDAEALIAFENSDITANAVDDFGGRIIVEAETILGTAYREALTLESDITATSALGPAFSGSVEINDPEGDPTEGTTELPEGLVAEDQIAAACEKTNSNTFVATGRGGLPEDASQLIAGQSLWNDFRLLEGTEETSSLRQNNNTVANTYSKRISTTELTATPSTIVEAQAWTTNSEGQTVLGVHTETTTAPQLIASCLSQ